MYHVGGRGFPQNDRSELSVVSRSLTQPGSVGYAVVAVAGMVIGNVPGGKKPEGLPSVNRGRLDPRLSRSCKDRNGQPDDHPPPLQPSHRCPTMLPDVCLNRTTQFVQTGRCYCRRYSCDTGSAGYRVIVIHYYKPITFLILLCCRNLFLPPGQPEFQHGILCHFRQVSTMTSGPG